MFFDLISTDGAARRGRLTTRRGVVETPAFMPVGTHGTVKAMTPEELREAGAQIILGNTFHLMLRPGVEVIRRHGGLHGFMGWDGPILTDSGGFQVWSLAELRQVSERGVLFRSPVDGDRVFLGPEESMAVQRALDSDIVMIFDECTPYPATETQARASMELSLAWARRSREAHGDSDAASSASSRAACTRRSAGPRSRVCWRLVSTATPSGGSRSESPRRRCWPCWTRSPRRCPRTGRAT